MAKKREIVPTTMQKNAADEVLKQKLAGENINYKKALKKAGYSDMVAHSPKIVTESKGYRAYLDKYHLNEDRVAALISEDINALGAGERFNYIKLLAQMMGMLEAKVDINVTKSEESLDILTSIINGTSEAVERREDSPAEPDL